MLGFAVYAITSQCPPLSGTTHRRRPVAHLLYQIPGIASQRQPSQFGKRGADRLRIWIDPLEWKCSALVGLDWIDAAEIVGGEIDARPVRTAFEHKALTVWGDFRLPFYEVGLAHAKKRGNAGDLRIRHANNAVLDATARPAATAMKIVLFHIRLDYSTTSISAIAILLVHIIPKHHAYSRTNGEILHRDTKARGDRRPPLAFPLSPFRRLPSLSALELVHVKLLVLRVQEVVGLFAALCAGLAAQVGLSAAAAQSIVPKTTPSSAANCRIMPQTAALRGKAVGKSV